MLYFLLFFLLALLKNSNIIFVTYIDWKLGNSFLKIIDNLTNEEKSKIIENFKSLKIIYTIESASFIEYIDFCFNNNMKKRRLLPNFYKTLNVNKIKSFNIATVDAFIKTTSIILRLDIKYINAYFIEKLYKMQPFLDEKLQ